MAVSVIEPMKCSGARTAQDFRSTTSQHLYAKAMPSSVLLFRSETLGSSTMLHYKSPESRNSSACSCKYLRPSASRGDLNTRSTVRTCWIGPIDPRRPRQTVQGNDIHLHERQGHSARCHWRPCSPSRIRYCRALSQTLIRGDRPITPVCCDCWNWTLTACLAPIISGAKAQPENR
jgi:hypothetical protein